LGPTREELARLLTEEISDIMEAEKVAGWTPWVILVSLVSASWVLIQDLLTGTPGWFAVETVFVVVTIGLHVVKFASSVLGESPNNQRRSGPFFNLHDKASLLNLLSGALWMAATAFSCFRIAPPLGPLIFGTTCAVYSFETLVCLFVMGMIIARVPFPFSGLSSLGRPVIVSIAFFLLTSLQVAAIALAVRSLVLIHVSLVDVRIGSIMALGAYGLVYLSGRMSGDGNSRRMLSEIRRDLALHSVSLDEGIHRTRIALRGMGLSDVVMQDMQMLLGCISLVRNEYEEALRKAEALRVNISASEHAGSMVSELDRLMLGNLLDFFESHEERVIQIVTRYQTRYAGVRRRLNFVSGVYKAVAVERDLLLREIYIAQEPVDQLQQRFIKEHQALQSLWNTWCPTNLRNHFPFSGSQSVDEVIGRQTKGVTS
jgi:hypothetical protein